MNVAAATTKKLSITTLLDSTVRNLEDETMGKIEDFLVDLEMSRIAYAVITFEERLNMGNKLYAIPFAAFEYNPAKQLFVLTVHKDRLKNAPGFDEENWPDTSDRTWGDSIHEHYGYKPYYNAF